MKKIITVDGPAGSGKEKISKYIARKYKMNHIIPFYAPINTTITGRFKIAIENH